MTTKNAASLHRFNEFGARRAVRIAAARLGVTSVAAEAIVRGALDRHGDLGSAVTEGLAALRQAPEPAHFQ
jgi:hypothetical protein